MPVSIKRPNVWIVGSALLFAPQIFAQSPAPPYPVQIAVGQNHRCARMSDASVWCWEQPVEYDDAPAATVVREFAGAQQVTAGISHVCVRVANGTVRCLGENDNGQLGDGTIRRHARTPIVVPGLDDVTDIQAGGDHTCALRSTGTVVCWGDNEHGELGDGTAVVRLSPVAVTGIEGVVQIAVGDTISCARAATGTAWCWGEGMADRANGRGADAAIPQTLRGLDHVDSLVSSSGTCVAARASRGALQWLGRGCDVPRALHHALERSAGFAVGAASSCLWNAAGTVRCWGLVHNAIGDAEDDTRRSPININGLHDVAVLQLARATPEGCALTTQHTVLCFGGPTNSLDDVRHPVSF